MVRVQPWFRIECVGEVTVLTFTQPDIWDGDTIQAIGVQLLDLVDRRGHRRFVLDFGVVTLLGSLMLGKLLTFLWKVQKVGGSLTLCSLAPILYQKFKSTRLNELLPICPNKQEALLTLR